jgi:acetylornithine/succinyldiaminopimelate/putrescine aminotransferase
MHHPLLQTLDQIVRQQTPNLFRLYLNPHVAQSCFCLGRMIQDTWYSEAPEKPEFQTFLANGFDEALSGALKLARFYAHREGRPGTGLILGGRGRLDQFATLSLGTQGTLELIPDLVLADLESDLAEDVGCVVIFPPTGPKEQEQLARALDRLHDRRPLVIAAVSRASIDACRRLPSRERIAPPPDVVVFDNSFVHHHVPFGAFTARKAVYDCWNRRGYTTFHSTTFQPNTVSTLHFLKCLKEDDPGFVESVSGELQRIAAEPAFCQRMFGQRYSPSLARMIASLGFDVSDVKASGHYVTVGGRRIFDGVAGVACSMRGHNPPTYVQEVAALPDGVDYHQAVCERMQALTGLEGLVPAVSGASAVENALRLGLAAQSPRKHVLALKGGFGGKTLFALTGTAKPFYKEGLGPLYPNVVYVDPFGDNAIEELDSVFRQHPVAVVQMELIQAVGGVRAVPEKVVRYLDEERRRWGYALFVDEVQTGMYRTGPFTMSERYGIVPDLLTVGKGVSDMMFPFAVTLYSGGIREKLEARSPDLPRVLRSRADYEFGYRTLLNTLDQARAGGIAEQVEESGALFASLLSEALGSCPAVRDVRVFGMLIAIELDASASFRKWFRKQAPFLYILNMLRHRSFPLLIGFCQYEPNVLKLTPPLSITRAEIEAVCATIVDVLRATSFGLLPPALGVLARSFVKAKWNGLVRIRGSYEPAAR